jgi:hypothetical protein
MAIPLAQKRAPRQARGGMSAAASVHVELSSSERHGATEIGAGAEIGPALLELMPATPGLGAAAESHRPARGATATMMPLIEAVLQQSRLDALAACDANVMSYDPDSFLMIFRCRGRQMPFVIKPLLVLVGWGIAWALIFARFEQVRQVMLPLEDLITPLLTPVSFLLVFRLGRAAVQRTREWLGLG